MTKMHVNVELDMLTKIVLDVTLNPEGRLLLTCCVSKETTISDRLAADTEFCNRKTIRRFVWFYSSNVSKNKTN